MPVGNSGYGGYPEKKSFLLCKHIDNKFIIFIYISLMND